jgi:diguanylate cyclase (GGDEF)-like protein/PAS domain S-box-containing protein
MIWIAIIAVGAAGAAAWSWLRAYNRSRRHLAAPSYQTELLHSLYHHGPVIFSIIDRQGRFLDINQDPSGLIGYTKEELAGQSFERLLDDESRNLTLETFKQSLSGETCSLDIRVLHKSGRLVDLNIATSPLIRRGKTIAILVFIQDISERKRTLERNHYMAYYDDMTGLPNRRLFTNRLEGKIEACAGKPLKPAICYLDVDAFKLVNTSFGRDFGDMLLMQIAERLMRYLNEQGDLARMEGDEFAGYLGEVRDEAEASAKVEALMKMLEEPFELNGLPIHLSVCIGVAVHAPGDDAVAMLRKADTALQRAKANGRNDYLLHTDEMDPEAMHKLKYYHEMRRGLAGGEFQLYYQPQFDLATGQIVGMEALLRWNHPERGLISPKDFISEAEESGIIVPLGDWVLEEACRQVKQWHQKKGIPKVPVSVNLSIHQFVRRNMAAKVAEVLEQTGLEAKYLELEITETMTMDVDRATQCLKELRELGVQVSIDDFGTGYSSFHYLKRLPIGRLKIDRSFIRDIPEQPEDAAIVISMISMAHNMQLQVIAEGVENAEQMWFLRRHRCDEMQGYYGSPPVPPEEMYRLLLNRANCFAGTRGTENVVPSEE